MLNDQNDEAYAAEFGGVAAKVGGTGLLLGLGIVVGAALFRTFSPGERHRRQRVSDARQRLREVKDSCRRKVEEAEEDVARARRGEITETAAKRSSRRRRRSEVEDFDLDDI